MLSSDASCPFLPLIPYCLFLLRPWDFFGIGSTVCGFYLRLKDVDPPPLVRKLSSIFEDIVRTLDFDPRHVQLASSYYLSGDTTIDRLCICWVVWNKSHCEHRLERWTFSNCNMDG